MSETQISTWTSIFTTKTGRIKDHHQFYFNKSHRWHWTILPNFLKLKTKITSVQPVKLHSWNIYRNDLCAAGCTSAELVWSCRDRSKDGDQHWNSSYWLRSHLDDKKPGDTHQDVRVVLVLLPVQVDFCGGKCDFFMSVRVRKWALTQRKLRTKQDRSTRWGTFIYMTSVFVLTYKMFFSRYDKR